MAGIGCYIPTDITFTPALFAALDVSEDAVVAARRSRVEWENRQRKKQGLDTLGITCNHSVPPSMPLARHILVTISESLYTVYIRGNDEVINGTG